MAGLRRTETGVPCCARLAIAPLKTRGFPRSSPMRQGRTHVRAAPLDLPSTGAALGPVFSHASLVFLFREVAA